MEGISNTKGRRSEAQREIDVTTSSGDYKYTLYVLGLGIFLDAYNRFTINLIIPMIAWEYYGSSSLPTPQVEGIVKGSVLWGIICGQLVFGVLSDLYGRSRMYQLSGFPTLFGSILCALGVWAVHDNPDYALVLMCIWRFILGIGSGSDYSISAVIASEISPYEVRGRNMAMIYAAHGVGTLVGAIIPICLLAAFENILTRDDNPNGFAYCWRIYAGFGALPVLVSIYLRRRIPETRRYIEYVRGDSTSESSAQLLPNEVKPTPRISTQTWQTYSTAFKTYFSEWSNVKVLIGCAASWFFLDLGYNGSSLNTGAVLTIIGYGIPTTSGPQRKFDELWNRSIGISLIISFGSMPGYWFAACFVEKWGRKTIQIMGFTIVSIIYLFLAIWLEQLKANQQSIFVVLFAAAHFFFNFGPNATNFILPGEIFPTGIRTTSHAICGAAGKLGAIVASQGFSVVSRSSFGLAGVLFLLSACTMSGIMFTQWIPETKGKTLEELCDEDSEDDDDFIDTFIMWSPQRVYHRHEINNVMT